MRIGIDARPLAHPHTGIGRYTSEIVTRLQHAEQTLFLYSAAPIDALYQRRNTVVRSTGPAGRSLSTVTSQLRFPVWASRDRLDVFWSPRHHLPLLLRTPTVVTIHDLVWRKAPGSMTPARRLVEQLLVLPSLRKADRVIAVSESTSRDIAEYQPPAAAKTHVIYEAPFLVPESNVPATNASQRPSQPYLLFVGTFEPRKNIACLLEAFAALKSSGDCGHRLVLAGNKGWKTDIAELLARWNLTSQVDIHSGTSDAELATLYQGCDIVILPSLYEGFGLPIVEAFAFAKPVITSNLSSMPEILGDAGLTFDPAHAEQLTQAMSTLTKDRELHQRLTEAAKRRAADFSWDRAARETLSVLQAAAEN